MNRVTIASIVEGYGEVQALPVLLRRIADELQTWHLDVPTPQRRPRSKLIIEPELTKFVQAAAERVPGAGGVLVLLDADKSCPADLGPTLQACAEAARPDLSVAVVLAHPEFESWLLHAAGSLGGRGRLPDPLLAPRDPERIRDAKGWLSAQLGPGRAYKPAVDQAGLTQAFDMAVARKASDSFDKMYREVARLLGASGSTQRDVGLRATPQ